MEQLADGTHPFAKRLASAKKPAVIIGTEALQRFTLILIPVAVKQGHDLYGCGVGTSELILFKVVGASTFKSTVNLLFYLKLNFWVFLNVIGTSRAFGENTLVHVR